MEVWELYIYFYHPPEDIYIFKQQKTKTKTKKRRPLHFEPPTPDARHVTHEALLYRKTPCQALGYQSDRQLQRRSENATKGPNVPLVL